MAVKKPTATKEELKKGASVDAQGNLILQNPQTAAQKAAAQTDAGQRLNTGSAVAASSGVPIEQYERERAQAPAQASETDESAGADPYGQEDYDEPQQEEEPAFVPIQSRSSAVSVLSGEKQGTKLLSPRELLESRKTGENPALALGRNIAQVKDNDAQEAAKNAATMRNASETARANTQRAADRAKNQQEQAAARAKSYEQTVSEFISADTTGNILKPQELAELSQYLNGGAADVPEYENVEAYKGARAILDEASMRAALLGDSELSRKYGDAVSKLDAGRKNATPTYNEIYNQARAGYTPDVAGAVRADYESALSQYDALAVKYGVNEDTFAQDVLVYGPAGAKQIADQRKALQDGIYEEKRKLQQEYDLTLARAQNGDEALLKLYFPEYYQQEMDAMRAGAASSADVSATAQMIREMGDYTASGAAKAAAKATQVVADVTNRTFIELGTQATKLKANLAGENAVPIRDRAAAMVNAAAGEAYREGATDGMSETAAKWYDRAVGAVSNLVRNHLMPATGLAMSGTLSGLSSANQAYDAGAGDAQALAYGLVNGLLEYGTEKISWGKLDQMLKTQPDSFWQQLAQDAVLAVTEAGEEGLNAVGNAFSQAILGDKGPIAQQMAQELPQNATDLQKLGAFLKITLTDATQAAKEGALSGFMTGLVSGGISTAAHGGYRQNSIEQAKQWVSDQGVLHAVGDPEGLAGMEGAAPAAQDRIASDAEAFLQALEPAKPQAQIDPMVDILLDPQKYLGGQEQTNESTVVNTNPENHTPVQQAVIDAYRSSVDDGLVQYVQDVMNDQVSYREKYNLNPMSDRASADIKALTGVDTTGFQTAIERKTIEHILKRHGEKGIQDRSMRDIHDIARIQYVLDNYDSMKEGDPAEGYTTIKPNGRPKRAQSVVYEKAVNGTYYVVEAVPDTKSKTAYIVSAYMSKNPNEKAGAFRLADAAKRPPYVTSETGYAATPAHDENAHQLLLHGQSLPQSMADDISVNNRLASAEPAVNTNMLKTGGNDAQNRPFTAGDISVQNTAASWQSADLEGRAKTPEQFRQRIHEQPYQQTIDAVKAAKEKARDARISAQKIKSVLGLDNAGRELFDLLVKNPGDQKSAALAVSQYGGRFMTAVQMQIDARTAKQQADAYARAIASARLEKAKELTSGLRFAPASAMKSAGNWFRNSDEVFLRTFGNTQRTRDFHRATVGMVDANEALRVTDLNQTLSQFESMRLNAAESALEQLISDTGLRQDHQTLMTAADLQRIAGADLTAQDTRRLAEIARRMQRETARAMKAIQKAGMDARSAMQETDAAKLPPQVGAAVRAYETAMEPLYAQARQVTDNERVQDIVALCGAGWINPQAVETLHDFSVDKILNAKEKLDAYYEKTWQDASDVYVLGGYDPIGHIAGYRPHTLGRQLQQKSGILGQAQALFGRLTDSALPLEIAGRTEDFKPGRRYMPNFQNSRTGFEGYLDSMAGLAQYAPAASHVVYHTGDIQMLRALGANIRLENASDTVRGDYLRILQNNELSDTEKQAAAASLPWGQSGAAAPFVTWLDEYTNIVAGKTSTIDRVAEKAVGRATLDFMAGIKRMTGAAMVKYNIGSAVSNLAPLFQAGDLGSVSMTKGLVQSTLDALSGNLSFYDQFDFVKNRLTQTQADLGYDRGVKAAAQKAGNFDLMGLVDAPVTRALARAYYNQAIRDGYSESEAVLHTNERLNSVMGGRSLGQNPLIFESKTLGPLTQYKRESYRDLWMRQRDMVDAIRADAHLTDAQKRARIVSSMARFTVGTAVFGEATGSALGYVVAFSPIHVIAEMLKAAGMLEDDNDEDKLGQEMMQIWDDVKARLSGQEAQRTVAQALGDFFNIRIGDGLAAQEYEGLSDVAKALLAPLWEEVPMVGSRQGQGSMPVINQGIALVGSAAQAWDILFSDMDVQDKATALAQGIGKQTARTFVPGGNQLQKTALGAADLIKGYHEGYNAKDDALQAQYALSQDPTDIVQTLLFGPSANAGARAYYESGSWPLRDAQQTRLDQLVSGGATYQEAFSQIREQENLLKDLGLSLSSDTESMQPLLEAVKQGRMDVQTAKQAVLSGREATGIQDADGKTVSGSVRNEALTDYLKLGLDLDFLKENRQ